MDSNIRMTYELQKDLKNKNLNVDKMHRMMRLQYEVTYDL